MGPPVSVLRPQLAERPAADRAREHLPVARVDAPMTRKMRRIDERLAANVAAVRPLAGVGPPVYGEVAALRERLPARLARVPPYPAVDERVPSETARLGECPVAQKTPVRRLLRFGHYRTVTRMFADTISVGSTRSTMRLFRLHRFWVVIPRNVVGASV